MTFQEAVQTCFRKYVTIDGRARRAEYWWFYLFGFLGSAILQALDRMAFGPDVGVLSAIFGLAILLPALAVGVRRLHDTDRSGWWLLLGLIPLIGAIILIIWFIGKGSPGTNRFGAAPAA